MIKLNASVSLTTVIVTSTVLLLVGLAYLLQAIDLANASKDAVNYELNLMRSRSCIEEGLNKIKYNPDFVGNASIPYSDGSCTVTVALTGDTNIKNLTIVSEINGYFYTSVKLVDISARPFTITNP